MSDNPLPIASNRPGNVRSPSRGRLAVALCTALLLGALGGTLGCEGDIEARMAEVRALQDVGQFTASIEELREILAIVPDLPEASYRLGVALVQTGEPSRAVWALEKAAESREYAIPAALLLATAHFSGQNFEATVAAANRVLELERESHCLGLGKGGRAYIVNEAHAMNKQAVAQVLTILERIPPHVVWIFTTTSAGQRTRWSHREAVGSTLFISSDSPGSFPRAPRTGYRRLIGALFSVHDLTLRVSKRVRVPPQ